jgi:hypothetical protein
MKEVEMVMNEINKVERFKSHIKFFIMDKYGFVLGNDVEKLKKLENIELEYEEGTLQGVPALRYKVFDPNNYQPFNSIVLAGERPASIMVQPDYRVENEFKQKS